MKSLLRSVYGAFWFGVLPFGLACGLVGVLSPAVDLVRDQPVPCGIIAFTALEMALWGARARLPLAARIQPPFGQKAAEAEPGKKGELRSTVESVVVAIVVAMTLRTFVVEAFKIPTGSMIPTLHVGDQIFVNKLVAKQPRRGDVIVFKYPEDPTQDFIKRVIAIAGDTLEVRGGHPVINGWPVPTCAAGTYAYLDRHDGSEHEAEAAVEFLEDQAYLTLFESPRDDHQGPFKVEPGEVWVMGDNRNNSHDSRFWFAGKGSGVPLESIKGRALFVWLSIDGSIDWSRMFAPVMGPPAAHGPLAGLPPSLKALEPAIGKCLRERPAVTRPPT